MTISAIEAAKLLEGTTPGPWRADGSPYNRIVWTSNENRVCFMAHTNGLDDARDNATSNLVAAAPDLARDLIASEAARKLAEERLAKAVEALRELAIHPEDNGDIMPGDFRDYYRDTCDFAAKALKDIDNG